MRSDKVERSIDPVGVGPSSRILTGGGLHSCIGANEHTKYAKWQTTPVLFGRKTCALCG